MTATRSDTQAVRLETPIEAAFAFISDAEMLPRWAVGFCRGISRGGENWIVHTATGECPLRIDADAGRGTIDFHMTPAPAVTSSAYSRLLPCDEGCEFIFTQLSMPGMPDAVFDASVAALKDELQVLRAVLRARAGCPA